MNFAPSRFFRLCTVSFRSPDSMDGMCVSIPYGRMGTFVRMSGMALVEYGVAGFLAGRVGNAVVRIWAVSVWGAVLPVGFLKDTCACASGFLSGSAWVSNGMFRSGSRRKRAGLYFKEIVLLFVVPVSFAQKAKKAYRCTPFW